MLISLLKMSWLALAGAALVASAAHAAPAARYDRTTAPSRPHMTVRPVAGGICSKGYSRDAACVEACGGSAACLAQCPCRADDTGGSTGMVPALAPAYVSPAQMRGLNPQPEPPGRPAGVMVAPAYVTPGQMRGLNPQPEPPGRPAAKVVAPVYVTPAEAKGLNPQPEPPGQPAPDSPQ